MEVKERVIEGDERTLVLFQALLNQGMPLKDIFVFLSLKGEEKEQFFKRNDLLDTLTDIETLKITIGKKIEELAMERGKNMKNNMNYINSHETNRQVFQDTMNWIKK